MDKPEEKIDTKNYIKNIKILNINESETKNVSGTSEQIIIHDVGEGLSFSPHMQVMQEKYITGNEDNFVIVEENHIFKALSEDQKTNSRIIGVIRQLPVKHDQLNLYSQIMQKSDISPMNAEITQQVLNFMDDTQEKMNITNNTRTDMNIGEIVFNEKTLDIKPSATQKMYKDHSVSKSISYTDTLMTTGAGVDVVETKLLPSSVSEILPKAKNVSCDFCNYTTNRRSHLNEHYRIIHLKVKVICDLCGKEFANINQHMRVVHKILRSGILDKKECQECQKEFYDLTKHMAKAHNLKYVYDYDCQICNMKFKSKFILQRHMQRLHGDKSECGECGKKVSNLDVHIKKVHGKKSTAKVCSNCGINFKKTCDLVDHQHNCKEHLNMNILIEDQNNASATANQEGNTDKTNTNLDNHSNNFNEPDNPGDHSQIEQDPNFYGQVLTGAGSEEGKIAVINTLSNLVPEENSILGGAEQSSSNKGWIQAEDDNDLKFESPVSQNFMDCNSGVEQFAPNEPEEKVKYFPAKETCEICPEKCEHMSKHLSKCKKSQESKLKKSITTYQCQLCGYTTNRATNYNIHYKMVHLKLRTVCELCGKEYSNINQHMRVVHKTLKSGMSEKHKCDQCGQEYYDLQQHMRRAHKHLVEPRDCTCAECGETFTKFANMKRHQQRVHQGIKITCDICKKQVSNIDKHKKVHKDRGLFGNQEHPLRLGDDNEDDFRDHINFQLSSYVPEEKIELAKSLLHLNLPSQSEKSNVVTKEQ